MEIKIPTNHDQQEERIEKVLRTSKDEPNLRKTKKTVAIFLQYLKDNIELPCILTGQEDFQWEEFYVLGPGDKKEYEELKKYNPSYTDEYELLGFVSKDEQILAKVKRISDGKKFVIGLDWLEATDKKSKNYEIINDYCVWYVNY